MYALKNIGEKKLIKLIIKSLRKRHLPLEIGDDATGIMFSGKYLVFKVDTIVGKYSLLPGMSFHDLGWRIVTATASDIIVKGGRPISFLLSITAPPDFSLRSLLDIVRGADRAAKFYGSYIDGGDTNEGNELVLSCAGLGEAKKLLRRLPLREGDTIAVTGFFGYTGLGFKYLLDSFKLPPAIKSKVLSKTLKPTARIDLVDVLEESAKYVRSSIDSSDGLAESLYQLLEKTERGGILISNMPVEEEFKELIDFSTLLEAVFYGGEEFEIIVVIKRGFEKVVRKIFEKYNKDLIFIGRYCKDLGGVYFLRDSGAKIRLERKGWEYF
ncbi:MAG: hypothetical protein DRJ52_01425 [Thermoprotei archaeon]|nr:MAG: hypothetical protein DRJ52_01425 [Thermoprotei archaeon]